MADVFLSHASSDRETAAALEQGLEAAGLSVWWDHELVPGQRFQETIVEELNHASAVVVLWTATSVKSIWVYSEARRAIDQGKFVQVRTRDLDAEDLPAPFDAFHCSDVEDVDAVVKAVRGLIASGGGVPPPPRDRAHAEPQRLVGGASWRSTGWRRRGLALAGLVVAAVATIVTVTVLAVTGEDDAGDDTQVADACLNAEDDTEPYPPPDLGTKALDNTTAIASMVDLDSGGGKYLRKFDTYRNAEDPGAFATDATRPTLSRDRKFLLYLRTCGSYEVPWIMGVDGTNQHPFFNPGERPPKCTQVNRPAWNWSGTKVALTCQDVSEDPLNFIYIFEASGKPLNNVNALRPSGGPTWVGDDALVYSSLDEDGERETLLIQAGSDSESGWTRTGEPVPLVPEMAEKDDYSYSLPDWSHVEGGRLLFLRTKLNEVGEPAKTGEICWMSLPLKNPQPAPLKVWSENKSNLNAPTWSPDGKSLMFLEGHQEEGDDQILLWVASFTDGAGSDWSKPIEAPLLAQPAWGPR